MWTFLFVILLPVIAIFYVMYLMVKALIIVVAAIVMSIYKWMIESHAAHTN